MSDYVIEDRTDSNDYEAIQREFENPDESSAQMNSIFDPGFSQVPRSEMYRAWTFPDLFPDEPQPRLSNWSDEDREAFCGIYKH